MRRLLKYVFPLLFILSCKDLPEITNPGLDPRSLPAAAFSFSNDPGDTSAVPRVLFEHVSRGLTSYWLWDFGDGLTSGAGPSVWHVYARPGYYLVRLIVFSPAGSDTSSATVRVQSGRAWVSIVGEQDSLLAIQRLDFGPIQKDLSSRAFYLVSNALGGDTLKGSMTLTGDSAFVLDNNSREETLHIPPGGSKKYAVEFRPRQLSDSYITASVTLTTNAANAPHAPLELRGYSPIPQVAMIPDTIIFGDVRSDSVAVDSVVYAAASSNINISSLDSVSIGDTTHFSLHESPTWPALVPPGGAQSIRILFRPRNPGIHVTSITLYHDGRHQITGILIGSGAPQ